MPMHGRLTQAQWLWHHVLSPYSRQTSADCSHSNTDWLLERDSCTEGTLTGRLSMGSSCKRQQGDTGYQTG